MAVRIRLMRMGRKKLPYYRIVVADSRAPRDGRFIEVIGRYNPLPQTAEVTIDESRLFNWLDNGASMTDTVKSLMRHHGLTLKYELYSRDADEATVNKELQKWEMARQEREKQAEAQKAQGAKKTKAEPKAETKTEEPAAPVEEPVKSPIPEAAEIAAASEVEVVEASEPVVEETKASAATVETDQPVETAEAPAETPKEPEPTAESESKKE